VFFDKPDYQINPELVNIKLDGNILKNNVLIKNLRFNTNSIVLSSYLTITISILTLVIILFIFVPQE
jgi:NADH-ubiquinone oxidoreductase chain 2